MATKIKQITPQFSVSDLEQAIAFYVQQLGFSLAFRYEDFYASVEKDGHAINLKVNQYSSNEKPAKSNNEDPDIIFSVEGITELFEELSRKDVEIVQSLREMPYGMEFYIVDPDGYLIAVIE